MKLPEVLKRDYMQTVIMILIVILFVFVFWYGLGFVFGTDHPILAVASGSMEPVLYAGDLIFVEGVQNVCDIHAAPKDADQPGDIIVFRGPRELIVHRAVEKTWVDEWCYYRTQGDANSGSAGWELRVGEEEIVGKYTGFKVPLLGQIALFFNPFEVKVAFILLWV